MVEASEKNPSEVSELIRQGYLGNTATPAKGFRGSGASKARCSLDDLKQGKKGYRESKGAPGPRQGLLPAFLRRMRHFLVIAIAFQCARLASAGTLSPLTAKEIVLMLRSGYSSETLLNDLATRHFAGPLDSNAEAEMRQLNASPKLLDELKSGQFDATTDELTQAQQKIAAANASGEELARQQRIALQNGDRGKSTSSQEIGAQSSVGTAQRGQERPHAAPQIIDLEIGQSLDLRDFGANRKVIVNGVDADGVLITLLDFDRMQISGGGDAWSGFSISSSPTVTLFKVKKEDNSVIYRWGQTKLVYLDVMDVAQNHIKLGIVRE